MKRLSTALLVFAIAHTNAAPPVVHPDGSATFRFEAPNAQSVQVDIKGRTSEAIPMERDKEGVWTYRSEPLDPGFHYYFLYLDGARVVDASSPLFFGWQRPTNGVEIPDPDFDLHQPREVPRGEIHIRPYFSEITQSWRRVRVYSPPNYGREPNLSYPVLYLQHGSGENQSSWSEQGRLGAILDNLIASGECQPMLVVMENGYAYAPDAPVEVSGRKENLFGKLLVEETIPLIETHFRAKTDRQSRAIAGLSMGAGQALSIALDNLRRFSYLGCFSGGGRDAETVVEKKAELNEQLQLFWIACGTEDGGFDRIRAFHETLEKAGVEHAFVAAAGTHEWQDWRRHLSLFAPLLFRASR